MTLDPSPHAAHGAPLSPEPAPRRPRRRRLHRWGIDILCVVFVLFSESASVVILHDFSRPTLQMDEVELEGITELHPESSSDLTFDLSEVHLWYSGSVRRIAQPSLAAPRNGRPCEGYAIECTSDGSGHGRR